MRYRDVDEGERISDEALLLSDQVDYAKFIDRLHREEGIDLSQYKQNQLRRRLNSIIKQAGFSGYCRYLDHARKDKATYRKFIDRITINVSEFLRNPEKFKILEERYLKPLLKRKASPLIWSAGCSTGEEPYSIALLLEKLGAGGHVRVLGGDIDRGALAKAEEGIYQEKALKNVPSEMVQRYFSRVGERHYQVNEALKRRVRLERCNLLEDRFPQDADIILCRNVVIYFKDRAKRELYVRFGQALDKNGVLMIGSSESIFNADEAGLRVAETFFYVRQDAEVS
ncbi:protein-glutamate O-methyltransferase CheR [bacterium]|nr:protein-glutamate O-methyltransferase CheR [bacterium]